MGKQLTIFDKPRYRFVKPDGKLKQLTTKCTFCYLVRISCIESEKCKEKQRKNMMKESIRQQSSIRQSLGYWKRGNQYWHIKLDETLLINLPRENGHYDGDGNIFFHSSDSPVTCQEGRVKIIKEEWEKVKSDYIDRLTKF